MAHTLNTEERLHAFQELTLIFCHRQFTYDTCSSGYSSGSLLEKGKIGKPNRLCYTIVHPTLSIVKICVSGIDSYTFLYSLDYATFHIGLP